jgi:hypothetical protein
MAEQKAEQEARRREMEPRKRDFVAEQAAAVEATRAKEQAAVAAAAGGVAVADAPDGSADSLRQTNEGRWAFELEEEDGAGNTVLRIPLSRFLDTSLVDVDVHPSYVSIVIKGRLFRLRWPEAVRAGEARCQRSQTTGELVVTAPKLTYSKPLAEARRREKAGGAGGSSAGGGGEKVAARGSASGSGAAARGGDGAGARAAPSSRPLTVAEQLLAEADAATAGGAAPAAPIKAVSLSGLTSGASKDATSAA